MFTSFSTALSALSAHTTAVDVVGNNLANLNTPGYKTSVVSFRDLVTQSLGAGLGETQVGFGTGRPFTTRQFTQGAIQSSTGLLDAAIQGDGFFIVRDSQGGMLFTRAGNFRVDSAGYLLTATGEKVQGWTDMNGQVDTNGPLGDVAVPIGSLTQPKATTNFTVDLNLNAAAPERPADPALPVPAGAVFSTPIEIVDSLGATHTLKVTFTKTGANTWDYSVDIPAGDLTAAPTGPLATNTLTFDDHGRLPSTPMPPVELTIAGLKNGAADMTITWDLYNGTTPRITQYTEASAPSANFQDGIPAASLVRVGLADGGKILAQYSNGQQRVVGQLALASIRNPESLIAVGNNNFQASARSAMPAIGMPDTGGRGSVNGGAIESSTVDIAREFTNLIVFQRGYQANSRVVTAVDELSQETMNLKR